MILRIPSRSLIVTLVMGTFVFANLGVRVEARPNYKKAFDATYPDVAKTSKTNCSVCHFGDDKKNRNHYGEALRKELKDPKVTDDQKIKDAIKAIESGDCKSGKWKERLEKGLAPCVCGNSNHGHGSFIEQQLRRAGYESR